ncbi:MAG TPA: Zn-dependent hydrolase [Candidatus Binatia bacterium]
MALPRSKARPPAPAARLAINKERLLADLNAISRIGIGDRGSVTRLVFSVTELRSRQLLVHLMTQAGLNVHVDRIGNIFGRLEGGGGPAVLAGSHLDSVVHGGKFDGPVGVIGALEAVRTLKESGVELPCPVEAVCFVGEESSRFGFSTLGSSLVAGQVKMKDLTNAVDARGTKLGEVLAGLGVDGDSLAGLKRDPKTIKAYLELHIEQGPVLEAKGKKIGVVTAIAAPTRLRVIFTGQADHSGTTPMDMRKDALAASASLITYVEQAARENASMDKGRVVGTVGAIKVDPGVINAIPGKVELAIDIRSVTGKAKDRVARAVEARAKEIAAERDMKVEILPIRSEEPVELDAGLIGVIRDICEEKKIAYEVMPSGAGHDAMQIAKIAPAGMIFVPSKKGISHSPLEWTDPEEICLGAEILLDAMMRVAYGYN